MRPLRFIAKWTKVGLAHCLAVFDDLFRRARCWRVVNFYTAWTSVVIAEQFEKADGYRSARMAGVSSGSIISGQLVARYRLRPGEGVELEQHSWYNREKRWTVVIYNAGGGGVMHGGRLLSEPEPAPAEQAERDEVETSSASGGGALLRGAQPAPA